MFVTLRRTTTLKRSCGVISRHVDIRILKARSRGNVERILQQDHDIAFVLPNFSLMCEITDGQLFLREVDDRLESWMVRLGDILRNPVNKRWLGDHAAHEDTAWLLGLYLSRGAMMSRKEIEQQIRALKNSHNSLKGGDVPTNL